MRYPDKSFHLPHINSVSLVMGSLLVYFTACFGAYWAEDIYKQYFDSHQIPVNQTRIWNVDPSQVPDSSYSSSPAYYEFIPGTRVNVELGAYLGILGNIHKYYIYRSISFLID